MLKSKRRATQDNYSFFPGQTARLNDVHYHNGLGKNETSIEEFRPNTLGFIYEEKDESQRVERMDAAMNWLFRVLTTCSFGVLVLIVYKHIAQRSKAAHYAALVT